MLDDFFVRALIAGFGVAIVAGPLGCFIVWRRLSYFGDTLAHGALLGVTMAFLLNINVVLAVFITSAILSLMLLALSRKTEVATDALLGLLSHSSLALGLVVLSVLAWIRVDLMGLLFGDILSVSKLDLTIIYAGSILVLVALYKIWQPLFAATVSQELAKAEGINVRVYEMTFMLLLACVIAISMKIVGVLLITALLIIPAATARRFASTPEMMALLASIFGCVAVGLGMFGSLDLDIPAGPSIVLAALLLFLFSVTPLAAIFTRRLRSDTKNSKEETHA